MNLKNAVYKMENLAEEAIYTNEDGDYAKFEHIRQEAVDLFIEQFRMFAERNPVFIKDSRQLTEAFNSVCRGGTIK